MPKHQHSQDRLGIRSKTLWTPAVYKTVSGVSYPIGHTIEIDNTGNANTLADYQVKLTIPADSSVYNYAEGDGSNIRFYDSDETTPLDYWYEEWIKGGISTVWIKVPSITGSSTKNIYLHVVQPPVAADSDGEATFLFFDHFTGDSLDTSKWNKYTDGSADVYFSNSIIEFRADTNTQVYIYGKSSKGTGTAFRSRAMFPTSTQYVVPGVGGRGFPPQIDTFMQQYHVAQGVEVLGPGACSYNQLLDPFGDGATYHVFEIKILSGSHLYYIDDTLKDTNTSCLPTNLNEFFKMQVAPEYEHSLYSDWFLSRKVTSPEPTTSFI